MPLKRGSLQPGDSGRGTRNPFGGAARRVFCLRTTDGNDRTRPHARLHHRDPAFRPRRRDRARRAAQAAARLGRLRLPRRARARRRVPGPRAGLRLRPAGQPDLRRRSRPRSTRWRRASRPSCFATGMAAIGASMLALLREGDHVVASRFLFGNTNSLFETLDGARRRVTFVDATDVARRSSAALTPATRHRVRRDDRQSAHAGRRPRAHRRAVRARGILYVVDNTMTSPWLFRPKTRRRGPRRQRADQVHRRPRQRARRAASPTPGSSTGRAIRTSTTPTRARSRRSGASRRSARRACATGAARSPPSRRTTSPSARRRSRCGWTGSARTRRRSRTSSPRIRRSARSTIRASPTTRSTRSRASCFAGFGALLVLRARRVLDCFDFLNRLRVVVSVVEPRRQPHAGHSRRAHDLLGDGRRAARRRWASPIR